MKYHSYFKQKDTTTISEIEEKLYALTLWASSKIMGEALKYLENLRNPLRWNLHRSFLLVYRDKRRTPFLVLNCWRCIQRLEVNMQILLANPQGFCAGVKRAINIAENALKIYGPPIYIRHEVVHNRYVVCSLKERGVIFVEEVGEVPDGSVLIFSAHGVSKRVKREAEGRRNLRIFDATCPLVKKVHLEVDHASRRGEESILIGHAGHPEVEGTLGQYNNPRGGIYLVESPEDVLTLNVKNDSQLSYMTQTTLSLHETRDIIKVLRTRFPKIIGPRKDDICYATTNRQNAVSELAKKVDIVLVVGSKNSSNAKRLTEVVQRMGKRAFLIDDASCIQNIWLKNVDRIGITAGASTPDILVQNAIIHLQALGGGKPISLTGEKEQIFFKVPKELCIDTREL